MMMTMEITERNSKDPFAVESRRKLIASKQECFK